MIVCIFEHVQWGRALNDRLAFVATYRAKAGCDPKYVVSLVTDSAVRTLAARSG